MRNSETSKDVDNSRLTERLKEITRMYRELQTELKNNELPKYVRPNRYFRTKSRI